MVLNLYNFTAVLNYGIVKWGLEVRLVCYRPTVTKIINYFFLTNRQRFYWRVFYDCSSLIYI